MRMTREDYDDASLYIQDQMRQRRNRLRLIFALILGILLALVLFFLTYFRVRYVTVEGSTHYTDEEVEQLAMGGFLGSNSMVLSWRYKNHTVQDVPFVESMDVNVVSHDSIRITVYEKSLAGYVTYLGRYLYFDRNGMVVESSSEKIDDVPEVTGLSFDHIVLHESLPVSDDTIFSRLLVTTQLLGKYGLSADRIYVGNGGKLSVYFGGVCANLGEDQYMDEKISNLSRILPSLEGKSGTLEMAEFTPDTGMVTFTEKK